MFFFYSDLLVLPASTATGRLRLLLYVSNNFNEQDIWTDSFIKRQLLSSNIIDIFQAFIRTILSHFFGLIFYLWSSFLVYSFVKLIFLRLLHPMIFFSVNFFLPFVLSLWKEAASASASARKIRGSSRKKFQNSRQSCLSDLFAARSQQHTLNDALKDCLMCKN